MTLNSKIMAASGLTLAALIIASLTGCSRDVPPPVMYGTTPAPAPAPVQAAPAPAQPVVVQQAAPAADNTMATALAAGAVGYLAGVVPLTCLALVGFHHATLAIWIAVIHVAVIAVAVLALCALTRPQDEPEPVAEIVTEDEEPIS